MTQYQFPPYAMAYVFATILCFLSAAMTWRRRLNPGYRSFTMLMLALATWSFASVFEAGATTVNEKIFWSKWQYIGITTVSPLWLLFAAEFTKNNIFNKTFIRYAIWVIPFATLALSSTNEWHGWIWEDVRIIDSALNIAVYQHGWFWNIHTVFSYMYLLLGTIFLLRAMIHYSKKQKRQVLIIIVGILFSWTANFLYITEVIPISGIDITPLSFSFVALLMAWSIMRMHIFDLASIVREKLLDSMQDGVILIDPQDNILEINPAALKITDYKGRKPPIGKSVWDVYQQYGEALETMRNRTDFREEVTFSGEPTKTLDFTVTSIRGSRSSPVGQLIVLRDITEHKKMEKREAEQHRFVEELVKINTVINSSLEFNEVLEKIMESVTRVVPHDAANIALLTHDGFGVFSSVSDFHKYGWRDSILNKEYNLLTIPNYKKMADSKQAIIVSDVREDPNWDDTIEGSQWIRSFVGAPIYREDKLLGFINIDSEQPNFFKPIHAERLLVFANQVSIALENANLFSNMNSRAHEMAALYAISSAINSGVGLEETTKGLFEQLKKVIPTDLFYLALYDSTQDLVDFYIYFNGKLESKRETLHLHGQVSTTRYVVEKRKTVYIPDLHSDAYELSKKDVLRFPNIQFDSRSYLGVPLVLREQVMGVLGVESLQANAFTPDHIRIGETIANQVGLAIENAKLFDQMQKMAITDGLTGLNNRRYFMELAEKEFSRAKRYHKQISVAMIDIDHFKKVNDSYGHMSGDMVLQRLAQIMTNMMRDIDVICRYGGEEFMILFPETSISDAASAAERLCKTIAETNFAVEEGSTKITISIGLAENSSGITTLYDVLQAADRALYDAKDAGRNCVRRHL